MDLFTFIAALTGHLAWPLAAILLAVLVFFRLPKLVKYVKTLRYKDLEVTIREKLEEAREEAEQVTLQQAAPPQEPETEKLMGLFAIDPSIAIIMVWRKLEQKLVEFLQHNGLMRFTTPSRVMQHLAKIGKISKNEFELFEKLRVIRNAAVHSREENPLSKAELLEFNNFVDLLIYKLTEIMGQPGYIDIPGKST